MKTNHRIRRSTTQTEPGTLGAPLFGVYRVEVTSLDAGTGIATVEARATNSTGIDSATPTWTPGKVIDTGAFRCWEGGVAGTIDSATVDITGTTITVEYTVAGLSPVFEVIAGHPALVAANGQVCGGALQA